MQPGRWLKKKDRGHGRGGLFRTGWEGRRKWPGSTGIPEKANRLAGKEQQAGRWRERKNDGASELGEKARNCSIRGKRVRNAHAIEKLVSAEKKLTERQSLRWGVWKVTKNAGCGARWWGTSLVVSRALRHQRATGGVDDN